MFGLINAAANGIYLADLSDSLILGRYNANLAVINLCFEVE